MQHTTSSNTLESVPSFAWDDERDKGNQILVCPSCGQMSKVAVGTFAACARCVSPDGRLTNMIAFKRDK